MELKSVLSKKLVKNSMWLFALQIFNTIIPLVTLPYITRVLGTNNYGVFSLALNWITYFQVIVEYGFGFTGARKVSIAESRTNGYDLQKLYSDIITARIILFIISYVLMSILFLFTHVSIEHCISMNILFLMIFGIAFQLTWLFQGKQDMKLITIINAVSRSVSVILVFVLIHKETHLYLYCFCYSVTFVFSAVIGVIYAKNKYGLRVKLSGIKEAFVEIRDGWYLFMSQAMSKIFSGIGTTVLGWVTTASVVGIYSAIYKIPFIMILFFNPISQALFPYVSVKFSESFESGRHTVKTLAKYAIIFFSIIGISIIILRDFVINIAFGSEYVVYADLIIPLVVWVILSISNNFLGTQYLVASGHQKMYSQAFMVSVVITVFLNIVLGYLFKSYGVAIAAALGEFSLTLSLLTNIFFRLKRMDL